MKLLTVGDSFTYGDELSDINNAWPFLLGKKLGYEVTNLAKPGRGNTQMIRHCVEEVANYDIAIVAWSHWARIEFADEFGVYDTWPGYRGLKFDDKIKFRHQMLQYITEHHNDEYSYNQHLLGIVLLQNYFKIMGKRYIMLNAFHGNANRAMPNAKPNLINQIDSTHYIGWPDKSMMHWTFGTPIGPRGHFLEDGHQLVADKIYEYIRHLSWVS